MPPELPSQAPASIPTATGFKDRSNGLTLFGILTICLGALFALLVPLQMAVRSTAAQNTTARMHPTSPGSSSVIVIYIGMALVNITLGIGSIKARRWARALMLIASWFWLIIGLVMLTGAAALSIFPGLLSQLRRPFTAGYEAAPAAGLIAFFILAVIFTATPAIWILFYTNTDVKATCEARNPLPSWTDYCPLSVLALSMWLAYSAFGTVTTVLRMKPVLVFFGTFLFGFSGLVGHLVLWAMYSYCAWEIYNLRLRGWWLVLLMTCALCISSIVTFSRYDLGEMFRLMGYSALQTARMKQMSLGLGWETLFSVTVGFTLFKLAYLLWVRKFFRKDAAAV